MGCQTRIFPGLWGFESMLKNRPGFYENKKGVRNTHPILLYLEIVFYIQFYGMSVSVS